jgi:hypothetical protein
MTVMTVLELLNCFHGPVFGASIKIKDNNGKQGRYSSCREAIEKWGEHNVRYWIIEENALEIIVD